jgi:glutathione S-transferase
MVRGFESNEEAKAKAKTRLQTVNLPFIRDQLGSKNFLLGDNYTLADVYMGYELWGLDHLKWMDDFPTLQAYVKRLMERPSWAATSPAAPEKAE